MIKENILYLISMWIKCNYTMAIFPWYMSHCDSQNDFFFDYIETITFCIVKCKPEMLDEIIALMPDATNQSLLEVKENQLRLKRKNIINLNSFFIFAANFIGLPGLYFTLYGKMFDNIRTVQRKL